MARSDTILYGDEILKVEPYGIQAVPENERHGTPRGQFTLWLGSNLTIADFALGFFPISIGLSWQWTIIALVVGNLLGGVGLALSSAMGPALGLPQLMISRKIFGEKGGLVPALLNYLSTIGWFSVNNILGSFGLRILFPSLHFWQAAIILVFIQGCLAVFGHNLIHIYERVMSIILGVIFAIVTVLLLLRPRLYHYAPTVHHVPWVSLALVIAAALSYIGSWAPYASDYSRYLPSLTNRRRVARASFWGSFSGSLWLELVGCGVAVVTGQSAANPILALHHLSPIFGTLAVVAIILGGTAADALNLYSNALAAGALKIRLPRWLLALIASLLGLGLSLAGSGTFEGYYDNFLLLLGYWLTPWLGVMLVQFYLKDPGLTGTVRAGWRPIVSFFIGLGVSIPFMSSALFTGPVALALGGADLTFYVGFVVSALTFWLLTRRYSSRQTVHSQQSL